MTSQTRAKEAARRLLADHAEHEAHELYHALLAIEGVGTTRLFNVLRELEADGEIAVRRVDRKVVGYRLATPTAEELNGDDEPSAFAHDDPDVGEVWTAQVSGREVAVRVTRRDVRVGRDGPARVWEAINLTNRSSRTLVWTDRDRFIAKIAGAEMRDRAIDVVADDLGSPAMAEAIGRVEDLVAGEELDELSAEQELEHAIGDDAAARYFAETVRRRLEAGVVDVAIYVDLTRRELDTAEEQIQELGFADELQTDQVVEKLARVERKRTILTILADELAGDALPGSASESQIAAKTDASDFDLESADRQALEDRARELEAVIARMRDDQGRRRIGRDPGPDAELEPIDVFRRRMAAWRVEWSERFAELRQVERRIADLTPHDPAHARELGAKALQGRAVELETLAETHGMGPGYYRDAAALRGIAAILLDVGGPYRIAKTSSPSDVVIVLSARDAADARGYLRDAAQQAAGPGGNPDDWPLKIDRQIADQIDYDLGEMPAGTKTHEEKRDATEAELVDEPEQTLELMAAGDLAVTAKTQELASAELARRRDRRA